MTQNVVLLIVLTAQLSKYFAVPNNALIIN